MTGINLSEDTMSRILTQAIIDGIGEDEKNNIIAQAVAHLTKPTESRGYGQPSKTPLQEAFDMAMGVYVNKVVREFIANDETVKAKVEAHLGEVLSQFGDRLNDSYDLRRIVVEAVVSYYAER